MNIKWKYTTLIILVVLICLGIYSYNKFYSKNLGVTSLKPGNCENIQAQNNHEDKIISWKEFQEKAQDENSVIVDLRSPKEIATGKLFKDALEINYLGEDYNQKISELDPKKTYLIYCTLGKKTVRSISSFEENGLNVYCLDGGIDVVLNDVTSPENKSLSWLEFQEKAQDENSVVIDIRTAEEFNSGKLFDNAVVDMDFYQPDYEQKISELDKTKTYLIYCRSGNRTGKSIPVFEKYGLRVYDLNGGHKATPANSLK